MKTSNDIVQILYSLFDESDLKTGSGKISGDTYKITRPSSDKEDIVFHCVALVGQSKQFGTGVVNIWVKDKDQKDQTVPNTKRIDVLAKKAVDLIESTVSDGYNMTIANQGLFAETALKYHFYSITVNFEFFNV